MAARGERQKPLTVNYAKLSQALKGVQQMSSSVEPDNKRIRLIKERDRGQSSVSGGVCRRCPQAADGLNVHMAVSRTEYTHESSKNQFFLL